MLRFTAVTRARVAGMSSSPRSYANRRRHPRSRVRTFQSRPLRSHSPDEQRGRGVLDIRWPDVVSRPGHTPATSGELVKAAPRSGSQSHHALFNIRDVRRSHSSRHRQPLLHCNKGAARDPLGASRLCRSPRTVQQTLELSIRSTPSARVSVMCRATRSRAASARQTTASCDRVYAARAAPPRRGIPRSDPSGSNRPR